MVYFRIGGNWVKLCGIMFISYIFKILMGVLLGLD